jgi:two-component system sensor histidine kinase KdpD
VIRRRFLPALASLLAVAVERERLAREAVEAEALRRSDTIKTAVLQAVSHDLRSPLTAVVTAVETLRSPSLRLQPDDREALLDTIATEAGRLGRLVRDLLDLSRLQAGAARSNREIWTVDELVGQALADLGPDGERVRVTLPTDLPPVATDAAQLRRVLANLIENALKFSPEQERVTVRATATRKEVIVRVVDCGPGIDQSKLDQVFEPFWRADTTGRVGGSGVGLAIAKGFTEANGGRIWAESRPGQGACFAVALPLAPVPAAAATA